MRHYFTCSAAPRTFKCPASAVLASIASSGDNSREGSAGHACLEVRANAMSPDLELSLAYRTAVQASIDHVDVAARRFGLNDIERAELTRTIRSFKWCPPARACAEVAFAADLDLNVIMVPRADAAPGRYRIEPNYKIAGTADLVWSEGGTLWVLDYKFGQERYVTPVDHNPQIWSLASMAARFYGAESVVPAICFVRPEHPEGIWEVPDGAPFQTDRGRLLQFEVELQQVISRVEALRERERTGDDITDACVTGPHCSYCPAMHACPPMLRTVRGVLGIPRLQSGAKDRAQAPLSTEEAQVLAEFLSPAGRAVRSATEMLRAYVDSNGPVELSDGRMWGARKTTSEVVASSQITFDVINHLLGHEAMFSIPKITKTALHEACRTIAKAKAQTIVETQRRLFKELGDVGAIQIETGLEYGIQTPADVVRREGEQ